MISTDRIVKKPIKIDLHIHSAASAHKDGKKVKEGTVDNIDVLFDRLEENAVNMAAITDHDAFDFSVYDALRQKVNSAQHLQRVIPGVEFTVGFKDGDKVKPVHVVTLFDDADLLAVQRIGNAIPMKNGKPEYDEGHAFSEDRYWSIIRDIGLDVVTIAHQKSSPGSARKRKNDANSVGDRRYNEFLFVDYFDAYEYKNRKNDLFNKSYAYSNDQMDRLRFVTGSDCHVWSAYPSYDAETTSPNEDFAFTYLKCLPTFRGLAMAVTDLSRIKTVPSFFSGSTEILENICLTLNGEEISIPLSTGINAIIGDNSIGKSSLLNALNGYNNVKQSVKKGQEKYLESSGVSIKTTIPDDYVLRFDGQDAIRTSFEGLSEGKARKQLEKHFPEAVSPEVYRNYAMGEYSKFSRALEDSCEYQAALENLRDYTLPPAPPLDLPESITFNNEIELEDSKPHRGLIEELNATVVRLRNSVENHSDILAPGDKEDFNVAFSALKRIVERHANVVQRIDLEKKIANKIREAVSERENDQSQIITDAQKAQARFLQAIDQCGSCIAQTVRQEHRLVDFSFSFDEMRIAPNTNPVGDLQFVCKLGIDAISPQLLTDLVDGLIGKRKHLSTLTSSYSDVADAINGYPDDAEDPIAVLAEKFASALDAKLRPVKAINRQEDDVYKELSRGYNAQMYFALMADRNIGRGIYIVDQPEDQISQKAIKESVIGEFREIASARQVILVTHNPQFIVNLDVDNVIFIGKKDGSLFIQSGALEYECDEYRMLQVVADNIEGGLETIQKRMKRYEKAS